MREKMIVVLLFAVVNSADWTLECNSDSIKITFDQNYLERQTGSRNHKLIYHGAKSMLFQNCLANLNNLPYSTDRGRIILILEGNFNQCATKITRLTTAELTDGDSVGDYKFSNTIYFNAGSTGNVATISKNFPDSLNAFIDGETGLSEYATTPVLIPLFEWECRYPYKYFASPISGLVQDDIPNPDLPAALKQTSSDCSTVNGSPADPNCFDYTNLALSIFPYSTPEFLETDILSSYQFADSAVPFFIVKNSWISIQTFLTSTDPTGLPVSTIGTAIKYCWINNLMSSDKTDMRNDIQLVIEGCAVDEKYTSIYATGLGSSTRFAFDTTNPEFDYLSYQDSPYYLHCEIQICFLGEPCPGACNHGEADEQWSTGLSYESMVITTRSGPYFQDGSAAFDSTKYQQVQSVLPSDNSYLSVRLEEFDEIVTDDREAEEIEMMEPYAIVLSFVGALAGIVIFLSILFRKCRRHNIYHVSRRQTIIRHM